MSYKLQIIYEDEWIVVINKPQGLLVHRSSIARNTDEYALQILRNQLGYYVYPIHRLDRKTSGILMFAKEAEFVKHFQEILSHGNTLKTYFAIVRGFFPDEIDLNYPLRNSKGRIQEAETYFRCLKKVEIDIPSGNFQTSRYSLITAQPKTGRMHQIRKHLNHLRHPIIGDRPHGCNKQNKLFLEKWGIKEMFLHAENLSFMHPFLKKNLDIKAERPEIFRQITEKLGLLEN
ncbi:MAG: pseudouridine synthase [Brumimicrobium sp.]|nr:pseudouridine synthase [Brumimicrobium sp.]